MFASTIVEPTSKFGGGGDSSGRLSVALGS